MGATLIIDLPTYMYHEVDFDLARYLLCGFKPRSPYLFFTFDEWETYHRIQTNGACTRSAMYHNLDWLIDHGFVAYLGGGTVNVFQLTTMGCVSATIH